MIPVLVGARGELLDRLVLVEARKENGKLWPGQEKAKEGTEGTTWIMDLSLLLFAVCLVASASLICGFAGLLVCWYCWTLFTRTPLPPQKKMEVQHAVGLV